MNISALTDGCHRHGHRSARLQERWQLRTLAATAEYSRQQAPRVSLRPETDARSMVPSVKIGMQTALSSKNNHSRQVIRVGFASLREGSDQPRNGQQLHRPLTHCLLNTNTCAATLTCRQRPLPNCAPQYHSAASTDAMVSLVQGNDLQGVERDRQTENGFGPKTVPLPPPRRPISGLYRRISQRLTALEGTAPHRRLL